MKQKITKKYLKELVYKVNGAAIEVHKYLGPGLLEKVYHKCMMHELKLRNIKFQSEIPVVVDYKGEELDTELRCDLLIEGILPVELKAVEAIQPIHEAQILTYMLIRIFPQANSIYKIQRLLEVFRINYQNIVC